MKVLFNFTIAIFLLLIIDTTVHGEEPPQYVMTISDAEIIFKGEDTEEYSTSIIAKDILLKIV